MSFVDALFKDKLHTNYVPSDKELAQIRSLLAEPLARLAQLDVRIEGMQAALEQLKSTRGCLQKEVGGYQALISPMRRVPQDVLQEIFIACLPTQHNALMHPSHPPLLFGSVCREWRTVSQCSPRLWSTLHIPTLPRIGTDFRDLASAFTRVLEAWLDRSSARLLSVSGSSPESDFELDPLADPLNALLKVLPRIRHLELGRVSGLASRFALITPVEAPALETFSILDLDESSHWHAANILQCPQLRAVWISAGVGAPALEAFGGQNITDLTLSCFSRDRTAFISGTFQVVSLGLSHETAFALLGRCPNLVRCELGITHAYDFVASSPITVPNLREFTLAYSYLTAAIMPIQDLILPKLGFLRITLPNRSEPEPFEVASDVPEDVLIVELNPYILVDDSMLRVLELLPQTTHLRIHNRPRFPISWGTPMVQERLLRQLTPTPSRTLCPLLSHLSIQNIISSVSDYFIVWFIRSWMESTQSLKFVDLGIGRGRNICPWDPSQKADPEAELQEYVSRGLQLNLKYSSAQWKYNPKRGSPGVRSEENEP